MPGSVIGFTSLQLGFPGTISRNDLNYVRALPVRPTDVNPINFGDPVVKIAASGGNGFYTSLASFIAGGGTFTAALFSGVAVRQARQFANYGAQNGFGGFSAGKIAEALERGTITVRVNVGSPVIDGPVYLRVLTNGAVPAGVVGGFEAASDTTNTILIPNLRWETGTLDANGVAELTILTRSNS